MRFTGSTNSFEDALFSHTFSIIVVIVQAQKPVITERKNLGKWWRVPCWAQPALGLRVHTLQASLARGAGAQRPDAGLSGILPGAGAAPRAHAAAPRGKRVPRAWQSTREVGWSVLRAILTGHGAPRSGQFLGVAERVGLAEPSR